MYRNLTVDDLKRLRVRPWPGERYEIFQSIFPDGMPYPYSVEDLNVPLDENIPVGVWLDILDDVIQCMEASAGTPNQYLLLTDTIWEQFGDDGDRVYEAINALRLEKLQQHWPRQPRLTDYGEDWPLSTRAVEVLLAAGDIAPHDDADDSHYPVRVAEEVGRTYRWWVEWKRLVAVAKEHEC